MRWLHQTGRWDRDAASADRVIPNSFKPHEVELQLFPIFFLGISTSQYFPWQLHISQLDHSKVTDPKFPQRPRVTIADGLAKELVDAYNMVSP